MNIVTLIIDDSNLSKKNLREVIERFFNRKKVIRFFISFLWKGYICVEILISE